MEVRGGEIYQMDLRFSWKSLFNYLVMCYNLLTGNHSYFGRFSMKNEMRYFLCINLQKEILLLYLYYRY